MRRCSSFKICATEQVLSSETPQYNDPWLLIEGPSWGDAKFWSEWLLACAQAQELWRQAVEDPAFEKRVELLSVWFIPDFGIAGCLMLMELKEQRTSLVISLHSNLGELSVMMAGMGFFARFNHQYTFAIPRALDINIVKVAMLEFAQTGDEKYILHPEYLVTTLSYSEAKACQQRRQALDNFNNTPNAATLPKMWPPGGRGLN
jgi:hypothetical protein